MVEQKQRTFILELKGKTCNVPALRNSEGAWVTTAKGKADLFAKTFGDKYTLEAAEANRYTELAEDTSEVGNWLLPSKEDAKEVLKAVKEESATGPDSVPTRVLKVCAEELAEPLWLLAHKVLEEGRWPEA